MAVKTVLRLGDPRLRQESAPVTDFGSDDLHQLVADMRDTMAAYDGAGLAAPQIGVMKRIVIFGVDQNPRYPDAETVPETVLCNPVIEPVSDQKIEGWEGCLSVPGLRGLVPRYAEIRYRGTDQEGRPIDRMAEGFHAIVVQHECDHLDGILYPDRIEDPTSFGFVEELADAGVIAAVAG